MKLKQSLNLKARGFFLDNVHDIDRLEVKEFLNHDQRKELLRSKKTELASMQQQDSVHEKSVMAMSERQERSDFYKSLKYHDKRRLQAKRSKKLRALQNALFKNAEDEFYDFKAEYDEVKRPDKRSNMLTDRIKKEEMYFNPILNRLG